MLFKHIIIQYVEEDTYDCEIWRRFKCLTLNVLNETRVIKYINMIKQLISYKRKTNSHTNYYIRYFTVEHGTIEDLYKYMNSLVTLFPEANSLCRPSVNAEFVTDDELLPHEANLHGANVDFDMIDIYKCFGGD